jgi:AcrR family transcriptional regulator
VSLYAVNIESQHVTPRKYQAPRRVEQAHATRMAIIDAAALLFAERGYGATTMAAIAAEAQVSAKSVYSLGDKSQLLTWALDRAIVGDDQAVPLVERPELQALLSATTPSDMARLGAALGAPLLLRLYPLYRAFEQAAGTDPQVAVLWKAYQERRRQDVRTVVLAAEGVTSLRPGLDTERATDTLWALIGWHPVALLVEERGWTPEDIQSWIEDLLTVVLLRSDGAR